MAVSRLLSSALGALLFAGCVHTQGGPEPTLEDEREVTALRERVARLERRLSDLDAQVTLLTRKVADPPRDSVSLGTPGYAPAPAAYASPPSSPAAWNSFAPSAPSHVEEQAWQQNPATRSIDLGPSPRASTPERPPLEPAEAVTRSSASSGVSESVGHGSQAPPRGDAPSVYEWARARMSEGRYLEAVAAFEDIVERFASHHLADNALYWTGVCHLERGEPRLAIASWRTLPLRFPASDKMPDSLYGMAMAHEELGEPVLAETLYGQLLQQYPKAEKRAEAQKALKRLRGAPDAPR